MVESDAEKLRERINVVRQAFLAVVLVDFLSRDAIGEAESVGRRFVIDFAALFIVSPVGSSIELTLVVAATEGIARARGQVAQAWIVVGVLLVGHRLHRITLVLPVIGRHIQSDGRRS